MKLMMSKIITTLGITVLTGCAHDNRTLFETVALHYDRADPCQTGGGSEARRLELGRPEGYQRPGWCGRGRTRSIITNISGQPIGYIK